MKDAKYYFGKLADDEKWQTFFSEEQIGVILTGAGAMLEKSTPLALEGTYRMIRFMIEAVESFDGDDK